MSRSRRGRFATVGAAVVALTFGMAACGNAKNGISTGGGAPGVTNNSITVGSIANVKDAGAVKALDAIAEMRTRNRSLKSAATDALKKIKARDS